MKVTIHVEGSNAAELAAGLRAHLALFEGGAATPVAGATAKPGRPKKEAAEEEEEDFDLSDQEDEEESDDSSDEEEAEETDEDEDEEEAAPKISAQDVIGAFQKYVKKNSREGAAKVLAKFKAKSVRDLKPAQYADVMKALKK